MDPRQSAYEVLYRIEKDKSYSNLALDSILGRGADEQNGAFITALVYGVLERKITLDYFISRFCTGSMRRIKTNVLTVLRMGIYQLYYMDKVPASAAVNESVELVKRNGANYAAGFVNGVMRAAAKHDGSIPDMKNKEEYYSVKYSCPAPLVNHLIKSYGLDRALFFLEQSLRRPPLTVRVNTLKTDARTLKALLEFEGVTADSVIEDDNALELSGTGSVEKLDAYRQGLFHAQDISSQLCCKLLDARPDDVVLDLCSAPGGKAFTAAQYMRNRGELYAFDLYENRVSLIKSSAERLGIDIIKTAVGDATVYNGGLPLADRVLCDVPCSGLGVIRRKPEIKYKPLDSFGELPAIQSKIIENGSKYVKRGGRLVYSTCTLNPAENERVVEGFLGAHGDFELKTMKTFLDDGYGGDGFFAAELIRVR